MMATSYKSKKTAAVMSVGTGGGAEWATAPQLCIKELTVIKD